MGWLHWKDTWEPSPHRLLTHTNPLDTHSQCEPGTTHVSSKGQRCLWSLKRSPGTRCGSSSFTSVSNHFIKLTQWHHSLCAWCHCVNWIALAKMKMTQSVLSLLYPNGHSQINHSLYWMLCSKTLCTSSAILVLFTYSLHHRIYYWISFYFCFHFSWSFSHFVIL